MKLLGIGSIILGTALSVGLLSAAQAQSGSFTGTVERVWEDGFRLNTGDRSLTVDSWDLYGDSTTRYLSTGDRITVTGEFEGREFDAFSIVNNDGSPINQSSMTAVPSLDNGFTGTVERVWEDGFRLNTGDRTITVDSWDVYGDFTPRYLSVGDRITVTGEFDGREFDAFSVINTESEPIASSDLATPTPIAQLQQDGLSGVVERVWEDGFRFNTGDRTITVDSWSLCRDFTANYISAGDRLTLAGEFDGGEFDAYIITNADGEILCR